MFWAWGGIGVVCKASWGTSSPVLGSGSSLGRPGRFVVGDVKLGVVWSLSLLILFQMDVDEETAEKFYQKLLELEEQTLERYGDLLD